VAVLPRAIKVMHRLADQIEMTTQTASTRATLSSPLYSRLLQTRENLAKSTFDKPFSVFVNSIVVEAEVAEDHKTKKN
jgi:hypothetical protein